MKESNNLCFESSADIRVATNLIVELNWGPAKNGPPRAAPQIILRNLVTFIHLVLAVKRYPISSFWIFNHTNLLDLNNFVLYITLLRNVLLEQCLNNYINLLQDEISFKSPALILRLSPGTNLIWEGMFENFYQMPRLWKNKTSELDINHISTNQKSAISCVLIILADSSEARFCSNKIPPCEM